MRVEAGRKRGAGQQSAGRVGAAAPARACAAALVFALLGLLAPRAGAQPASEVRAALEATQAAIDRASATLRCPPRDTGLACTYYTQALSLQTSARASYSSGFLRDAMALTMRARKRVDSALSVGQDTNGGGFVRFSLERTDALLERIAPPVRESGVGRARRLLGEAYELQRRARLVADEHAHLALAATFQARQHALGALRVADAATPASPENARAILERTDDLLRAEAWLADAGASSDPYARAIDLQRLARGQLSAGQAKRAVELSLSARDTLAHAFGKADHPLGRAAVERRLSDNATALESAREHADGPAARDRLARAEEHHRQAQEHYRAGHFAMALSELHASREALREVIR